MIDRLFHLGAPVDPDFADVNDYIMGDMTPEQAFAFEARMADDPALFEKVWPSIMIAEMERSDEAKAYRARNASTAELIAAVVPGARVRPRAFGWRAMAYLAASIIAVVLGGGSFAYVHASRGREVAAELQESRANTGGAVRRTQWATGPRQTDRMVVRNGVVTLRPNSLITFNVAEADRRFLDGDALFAIRSPKKLEVVTATARVRPLLGYFEISSVPGSGRTTVYVYEGHADVAPVGRGAFVTVQPLHRAVVGRDGSVVLDSINASSIPPKDWITRLLGGGR
jgi:hypothetical protein